MIVISNFIVKSELKPLAKHFSLEDILDGARKVKKNLGILIKNPVAKSNIRFFKVRIGGLVKGRMIVFITLENEKIIPVLIRLKKDKLFGMNMAMNNKKLVEQLNINFENIIKDIEKGDFEEFEL